MAIGSGRLFMRGAPKLIAAIRPNVASAGTTAMGRKRRLAHLPCSPRSVHPLPLVLAGNRARETMKRTHLPLNALRVFDAAARHLSFTRAEDELAVTPA